METAVKIFSSPDFGAIRIIDEFGKPLFSSNDVSRALGYSNPRKAVLDHCKGVTKRDTLTEGGVQSLSFIPESDVYRLVMRSKLESAEKFQDWVCEDVLPTIRRHGAYLTPEKVEEALLDPDTIIRLATQLKAERAKNSLLESCNQHNVQQLKKQAPKVLFANAVEASNTSILVGELAKILNQNGVNIGQNRLFEWLRNNGYLISRRGTDYNMPTQRSMDLGLFEIKETAISHADGHVSVSKTSKVKGKGQTYFINRFLYNKNMEG